MPPSAVCIVGSMGIFPKPSHTWTRLACNDGLGHVSCSGKEGGKATLGDHYGWLHSQFALLLLLLFSIICSRCASSSGSALDQRMRSTRGRVGEVCFLSFFFTATFVLVWFVALFSGSDWCCSSRCSRRCVPTSNCTVAHVLALLGFRI